MVLFTDKELVAEFSDLGVDIDKDDVLDKCKETSYSLLFGKLPGRRVSPSRHCDCVTLSPPGN